MQVTQVQMFSTDIFAFTELLLTESIFFLRIIMSLTYHIND